MKLDISPNKNTTMLVDTGAQISLIKNNAVPNPKFIKKDNKITIKSLHGTEETLGKIDTTIHKENTKIPIQLHVTNNPAIKEDGILGYDFISKSGIVDGPNKLLKVQEGNASVQFPINTINHQITKQERDDLADEVKELFNIEYMNENEIFHKYKLNLQQVQNVTQEINEHQIKISKIM